MPKEFGGGKAFVRTAISWAADGGASALAPDFGANTLLTVFGGTGGYKPYYTFWFEALEFTVGNADFASGGGGTLTFDLVRDSATVTANNLLAELTIPVASALRGVTLRANFSNTNKGLARIADTTPLFLVRKATGTVMTGGQGDWRIVGRQMLQAAV